EDVDVCRVSSRSPSGGARFVSLFRSDAAAASPIYTLSLHDALPISLPPCAVRARRPILPAVAPWGAPEGSPLIPRHFIPLLVGVDRKSTRLNSSHVEISYAVFCLKKKTRQPEADSVALANATNGKPV